MIFFRKKAKTFLSLLLSSLTLEEIFLFDVRRMFKEFSFAWKNKIVRIQGDENFIESLEESKKLNLHGQGKD